MTQGMLSLFIAMETLEFRAEGTAKVSVKVCLDTTTTPIQSPIC
jgi:hypothetical protein